jgi:tetratricopeptide (TPR) repeat protein
MLERRVEMTRGVVAHLLLAAIALVAFLPAFGAGYTNWDDPPYVIDNPRIEALTASHLSEMFFGPGSISMALYIPFTELSYAVDRALFGVSPFGHHVTNVALHVAAGLLLFAFLSSFLRNFPAAFATTALFLVHPVQVESVAWIAERKSVLSGLFIFATLVIYHRRKRPDSLAFSISAEWPALGFTLVALLSKPIAVAIPLILAALDLTRADRDPGRDKSPRARVADLLQAAVSKWPYLLLTFAASAATLYAHASRGALLGEGREAVRTLATMLSVIPYYARLALFPTQLNAIHMVPERATILDPMSLVGLFMLLALVYAAIRLGRHSRVIPFFAVWGISFMLPVSNIVHLDIYMAERYLYLPLVALVAPTAAAAVCGAQGRGRAARNGAFLAAAAVLLCFGSLTFARAGVWKESESLWRDTLAKSPGASKAHVNFGLIRLEQNDLDSAKRHFREAIRLKGDPDAALNLGIALSREGSTAEALQAFEAAKRVSPRLGDVDFWRGRMLSALGRGVEAEEAYREEIARRPGFVPAWVDLAAIQVVRGRMAEALASSEKAVSLDPDNPEALLNVGILRWQVRRDGSRAREALEACIRYASDPSHADRARRVLAQIGSPRASDP